MIWLFWDQMQWTALQSWVLIDLLYWHCRMTSKIYPRGRNHDVFMDIFQSWWAQHMLRFSITVFYFVRGGRRHCVVCLLMQQMARACWHGSHKFIWKYVYYFILITRDTLSGSLTLLHISSSNLYTCTCQAVFPNEASEEQAPNRCLHGITPSAEGSWDSVPSTDWWLSYNWKTSAAWCLTEVKRCSEVGETSICWTSGYLPPAE